MDTQSQGEQDRQTVGWRRREVLRSFSDWSCPSQQWPSQQLAGGQVGSLESLNLECPLGAGGSLENERSYPLLLPRGHGETCRPLRAPGVPRSPPAQLHAPPTIITSSPPLLGASRGKQIWATLIPLTGLAGGHNPPGSARFLKPPAGLGLHREPPSGFRSPVSTEEIGIETHLTAD